MPALAHNRLSPKKLLLSKWTAVAPRDREKHFLVIKVCQPVAPALDVSEVELEALYSKRSTTIAWRELSDPSLWRQGWL